MTRATALQEVRQMRFEELYERRQRRELTMAEVGDGPTPGRRIGCQWDLIVTLDDASSEVYSAFFVEKEGTRSSFQGLREVIAAQGLFSSLYTGLQPALCRAGV